MLKLNNQLIYLIEVKINVIVVYTDNIKHSHF